MAACLDSGRRVSGPRASQHSSWLGVTKQSIAFVKILLKNERSSSCLHTPLAVLPAVVTPAVHMALAHCALSGVCASVQLTRMTARRASLLSGFCPSLSPRVSRYANQKSERARSRFHSALDRVGSPIISLHKQLLKGYLYPRILAISCLEICIWGPSATAFRASCIALTIRA